MNRNNNHEYRVCVHACTSFSGSLWFVLTWIWQAGAPLHPHLLFSRLLCITSACTALLLNVLHVDMFSTFDMFYMMFTAVAPVPLSFFFFNQFFSSLAVVSSIRKTGAMVKASHCRQMLFSIWHDASSRSHFHCDCRAPSESIDNPCQALAPPTGAGTAS